MSLLSVALGGYSLARSGPACIVRIPPICPLLRQDVIPWPTLALLATLGDHLSGFLWRSDVIPWLALPRLAALGADLSGPCGVRRLFLGSP